MRPLLILLSLFPQLYVAAGGLREAGPSGFLLTLLLWNLVPVVIGTLVAYSKFQRQGVGWLLASCRMCGTPCGHEVPSACRGM
jgi:hypothetical protein